MEVDIGAELTYYKEIIVLKDDFDRTFIRKHGSYPAFSKIILQNNNFFIESIHTLQMFTSTV